MKYGCSKFNVSGQLKEIKVLKSITKICKKNSIGIFVDNMKNKSYFINTFLYPE